MKLVIESSNDRFTRFALEPPADHTSLPFNSRFAKLNSLVVCDDFFFFNSDDILGMNLLNTFPNGSVVVFDERQLP